MTLFPNHQLLKWLGRPTNTWGHLMYRTAYEPEYDDKSKQALAKIDGWVKELAYNIDGDQQKLARNKQNPTDCTRVDDGVMLTYQKMIIENEKVFSNASPECICQHFWVMMSCTSDIDVELGPRYFPIELVILDKQEINCIISRPLNKGNEYHRSVAFTNAWYHVKGDFAHADEDLEETDHCVIKEHMIGTGHDLGEGTALNE